MRQTPAKHQFSKVFVIGNQNPILIFCYCKDFSVFQGRRIVCCDGCYIVAETGEKTG